MGRRACAGPCILHLPLLGHDSDPLFVASHVRHPWVVERPVPEQPATIPALRIYTPSFLALQPIVMALQAIAAVLFVWQPTARRGDGPLPMRGYTESDIVDALFRLRSSMRSEMSDTSKDIKSMRFSEDAGSYKTFCL
ncbi:hypothetical protein B5807_05570 [Epicoccum nigrum]|uniref:Uncharacterized protein n=1 Tax=Epicoccum nigrum TaxID=105696 RepID=A0A1Y2LZQ7_EPING|nr:hypothetical protein B5807_05570 [Epicoccum nigrum]